MSDLVSLIGYHLTFDAEMSSAADLAQFTNAFPNGDRTIPSNNEAEYYADNNSANPVNPFTFANGALSITASPAPVNGQPYTSGMLQTASTFQQNQGYFEIRAQTTSSQGFWPGFWLLPNASYPEIDILEQPNNENSLTQYFNHTTTPSDSSGGFTETGVNLSAAYHTYGFMWTANTIQYTFDGNYINSAQATPVELANLKMFLIANFAVGGPGSWPGTPANGASAQYNIDYIRAYSNDPSTPSVALEPIFSPDGVNTTPVLTNQPSPVVITNDAYGIVNVGVTHLQAPINGISTTDFSSADLGAVLAEGAKFAFINGTEAVLLTDSTLSVGVDTNEATIQRLYEGLLGRGGDTGGLSGFDAQLTSGVSKATVASEFLNSPEYVAAHGTPPNDQFVASLYQGVLGRVPDPGGAALWSGLLGGGVSRGDVAVAIADSPEAKSHLAATTAQVYVPNAAGTLVHELFETGLGREVDLASLPNFKAAYATQTPAQLAADIAGSPEFINDHIGQNNAAYVSSLYQDGLGRAPDAAGSALWTGQLDSGSATRSDVLLNFAVSSEGAAHLTHNLSA